MIGPGHPHDPSREGRARPGRAAPERVDPGRVAPDRAAARSGGIPPGVMWPGAAHVGAPSAGATAPVAPREPRSRPGAERRAPAPPAGAGDAAPRGGEDRGGGADPAEHARATRRGLTVLGVLAALGCLQLLFMIGVELDRTLRHRAGIAALEAELAELDREVEGLEAVIRHADDPVYREQLARRQGFMAAGESRVVVLPGTSP